MALVHGKDYQVLATRIIMPYVMRLHPTSGVGTFPFCRWATGRTWERLSDLAQGSQVINSRAAIPGACLCTHVLGDSWGHRNASDTNSSFSLWEEHGGLHCHQGKTPVLPSRNGEPWVPEFLGFFVLQSPCVMLSKDTVLYLAFALNDVLTIFVSSRLLLVVYKIMALLKIGGIWGLKR